MTKTLFTYYIQAQFSHYSFKGENGGLPRKGIQVVCTDAASILRVGTSKKDIIASAEQSLRSEL